MGEPRQRRQQCQRVGLSEALLHSVVPVECIHLGGLWPPRVRTESGAERALLQSVVPVERTQYGCAVAAAIASSSGTGFRTLEVLDCRAEP